MPQHWGLVHTKYFIFGKSYLCFIRNLYQLDMHIAWSRTWTQSTEVLCSPVLDWYKFSGAISVKKLDLVIKYLTKAN